MANTFFGTDGIRGSANAFPMTSEVSLRVGMAAGALFTNGTYRPRVVIGKDTRLSGYMIETALVSGFTAVGMDVFLLGPMPTPAVAMLTRSLRADLGVMITASHNPFTDNGIKLFGPDSYKLSDEKEAEIEGLMEKDTIELVAAPENIGKATRIDSACERYVEFVKRTLSKTLRLDGVRIVIDCANGAAYKVAPEAFWELGAEVFTLGVDPNGVNINKDCGSTSPGHIVDKVREARADVGIAFDGDADRVVIVDEKGKIIDGDLLMAVLANAWLERGRLSGGGVVGTVMSNLSLERYLNQRGLKLERTQVGDRYVIDHMRRHGFNIGGEQCGHLVLSDFCTSGDGLVTALQVLEVVVRSGKPVSEICNPFEPLPQILKNVRYKKCQPLDDSTVQQAISDGRSRLGAQGRLVVRPSGTEPVIRIMAEGEDEKAIKSVVSDVAGVLSAVAA
jgi:phosphoglucosamine mutase